MNSQQLLDFWFFHLELNVERTLPGSLEEIISLSEELQIKGEVNWILADISKRCFYFNWASKGYRGKDLSVNFFLFSERSVLG